VVWHSIHKRHRHRPPGRCGTGECGQPRTIARRVESDEWTPRRISRSGLQPDVTEEPRQGTPPGNKAVQTVMTRTSSRATRRAYRPGAGHRRHGGRRDPTTSRQVFWTQGVRAGARPWWAALNDQPDKFRRRRLTKHDQQPVGREVPTWVRQNWQHPKTFASVLERDGHRPVTRGRAA